VQTTNGGVGDRELFRPAELNFSDSIFGWAKQPDRPRIVRKFPRKRTFVSEQVVTGIVQNYTTMKTTKLVTAIALSAGLTFGAAAQAKEKHEEETIGQADVPMAVQKSGESEAKGGRIVRWEKEGKNYEAVIEKNGKKWGVEINGSGEVLSKHDESKEHAEKKG
jgi:plastocyanin